MEIDDLITCEPEDGARFHVLAESLSLDEASEVAFRQRVEWLKSDPQRMEQLAEKAALEWLAYVLAIYQAASGRQFKRLPTVFDLPTFRSMRGPVFKGLIENGIDLDELEDKNHG